MSVSLLAMLGGRSPAILTALRKGNAQGKQQTDKRKRKERFMNWSKQTYLRDDVPCI